MKYIRSCNILKTKQIFRNIDVHSINWSNLLGNNITVYITFVKVQFFCPVFLVMIHVCKKYKDLST